MKYYIQETDEQHGSYWWADGGVGYCDELQNAGEFEQDEAEAIRRAGRFITIYPVPFVKSYPEGEAPTRELLRQWIRESYPMKLGDLIIVNETDAPESKLIAKVIAVNEDGSYNAKYMNIEWDIMENRSKEDGTLVSDFGVDVIPSRRADWIFEVRETDRESIATYPDGRPRKWEGYKHPKETT